MHLVVILVAAVAGVWCSDIPSNLLVGPLSEENVKNLFNDMKTKFGKAYRPEEEKFRLSVFTENLIHITRRNEQYQRGEISFFLGINQFTDLTNDEYRAGLSPMKMGPQTNVARLPKTNATAVDWRKHGAVTPVKNQGQCGSCWSFSTTGSTEGAWAIATGKLVSLSEQQLMGCSYDEGNMGCDGGLMDQAFKYIIKNGGLDSETDYPYVGVDTPCDVVKTANQVAWIDNYTDVPKDEEDELLNAVARGPVSVAIEADSSDFQSYSGGIFDDAGCGTQLDHGVLAVGFNTTSKPYWIVKNSWGASWGDNGYILMARGVGSAGICGIASSASYPQTKGGPKPPHPRPTYDWYYGDPNIGNCRSDEQAVNFTSPLSGSSCVSPCRGLFKDGCEHQGPPDAKAKPKCILHLSNDNADKGDHCILECDLSSKIKNHGCPDRATCKTYQDTAVCTYDS